MWNTYFKASGTHQNLSLERDLGLTTASQMFPLTAWLPYFLKHGLSHEVCAWSHRALSDRSLIRLTRQACWLGNWASLGLLVMAAPASQWLALPAPVLHMREREKESEGG